MVSGPVPLRPKPLHWFLVHALAWVLAIGLWPAPRVAYPALFHAHANALLAWIEVPSVHLASPAPGSDPTVDTVMTGALHAGAEAQWESSFSVAQIGYWPAVAFAALLLAAPASALRRAVSLVLGLALLDLVTLVRIALEIAYASDALAHGPDAPAQGLAHVLLRVGSDSLTATIPSAAFVLVCWVIAARPWRAIDLRAAQTWIAARGS